MERQLQSDIVLITCEVFEREISVGLTRGLLEMKDQGDERMWKETLQNDLAIDLKLFGIGSISFHERARKDRTIIGEPDKDEADLLKLIAEAMHQLNLPHGNCRIVNLTLKRNAAGATVEASGGLIYAGSASFSIASPRLSSFLAVRF